MPKPPTRRGFLQSSALALSAMAFTATMTQGQAPKKKPTVEEVQKTYGDDLMKLKGVVGHGIGLKGKDKALLIMVKDEAAKDYLTNLLRDTIEGHPIVIQVTGVIKPR